VAGFRNWERWLKVGWHHPNLARQKITERLRTKWRGFYDYRKGDGSAPPPITLGFNLSFLCNLRCKMCGQWREGGNLRGQDSRFLKEMLSLDELKRVIDDISPFKPDIYIWGGEPLLHPQIADFLEYIKQKQLICNLNTNGTLLKGYADKIVELGIDGIALSINGPPEVHDAISGVRGTFDKVQQGIQAIQLAKRRNRSRYPMLKINYTLSDMNCQYAEEFANLVSSEPAFEALIFSLGWFTTEEIGLSNDRVFQKLFGCESTSWKGFIGTCGNPDIPTLERLFLLARQRTSSPLITFLPSISSEQLSVYYQRPDLPVGRDRCISPWIAPDIRPNGDVTFCPDYPDYIIGNIKEELFTDIWNGDRARYFRNMLRKYKLFPICSRCCGLYSY
jgi:MoaA/NifB/PqqE/SkfB family radical SAM enzyme